MARFSPFKKRAPQALLNVPRGPIPLPPSGFSSQKQVLLGRVGDSISDAKQADNIPHFEKISSSSNFFGNDPSFLLEKHELDDRLRKNHRAQTSIRMVNTALENDVRFNTIDGLRREMLLNNKKLFDNLKREETVIKNAQMFRDMIINEAESRVNSTGQNGKVR